MCVQLLYSLLKGRVDISENPTKSTAFVESTCWLYLWRKHKSYISHISLMISTKRNRSSCFMVFFSGLYDNGVAPNLMLNHHMFPFIIIFLSRSDNFDNLWIIFHNHMPIKTYLNNHHIPFKQSNFSDRPDWFQRRPDLACDVERGNCSAAMAPRCFFSHGICHVDFSWCRSLAKLVANTAVRSWSLDMIDWVSSWGVIDQLKTGSGILMSNPDCTTDCCLMV